METFTALVFFGGLLVGMGLILLTAAIITYFIFC
jgi:hypothetical protein